MDNQKNSRTIKSAQQQAHHAASQDFLERRPDPSINRQAYEQWYYSLTPDQQRTEWQLYYNQQSSNTSHSSDHTQVNNTVINAQTQPVTTHNQIQPTQEQHTNVATSEVTQQQAVTVDKPVLGGIVVEGYELDKTQTQPAVQAQTQTSTSSNELKNKLDKKIKTKRSGPKLNPLKPFFSALTVGLLIVFLAYNQVVFAQVKQYIRPERELKTPIIINPSENPCEEQSDNIFIQKINLNSPVVYDEKSWDNDKIDLALERGVVHYGTTALPGEAGNNVIVGHSSGNLVNQGDFKYEFVLLDALEKNDTISLCYNNEHFVYKVFRKEIVSPDNLTYIYQEQEGVPNNANHLLTLITCHPPGTAWRRLIVQAVQISPQPSVTDRVQTDSGIESVDIQEVPSDSRSFWRTVIDWF